MIFFGSLKQFIGILGRKYDGRIQLGHLFRPYVNASSRGQGPGSVPESGQRADQKHYRLPCGAIPEGPRWHAVREVHLVGTV